MSYTGPNDDWNVGRVDIDFEIYRLDPQGLTIVVKIGVSAVLTEN